MPDVQPANPLGIPAQPCARDGRGLHGDRSLCENNVERTGRIQLLRAVDPSKDQSYVLHVLDQEKLEKALFPVGEYQKAEIRKIAAENDLPAATRHDSQDLCFLAGEDYRDFIKRNNPGMLTRETSWMDRGKSSANIPVYPITPSASGKDLGFPPRSLFM